MKSVKHPLLHALYDCQRALPRGPRRRSGRATRRQFARRTRCSPARRPWTAAWTRRTAATISETAATSRRFSRGGTRRDARARILAQTRRRVSPVTRGAFPARLSRYSGSQRKGPACSSHTHDRACVSSLSFSFVYHRRFVLLSRSFASRSRLAVLFFFFSDTSHAARARDAAGASAPDFRLFRPSLKWWNFSSGSYPRTTLISADPPATTTSTVSSGAARSTA